MERPTLEFVKRMHCGKVYFYPHNEQARLLMKMIKTGNRHRRVLLKRDLEILHEIGVLVKIFEPSETLQEFQEKS